MASPAPSVDPSSRVGTVVAGKYRLERLLGAGGMGAVFEAVHTGVERRFAVKVMTADLSRNPEAVTRFTKEARAAGLIGHPHIVEVFDLGESEDGSLYMVMELLDGETLHAALKRGPLEQRDAVAIALELLRALEAAHHVGIVHRDVKPQNLFLARRPDGTAGLKVLDFGIAKFHELDASTITRSGAILGTPLYMAPEQVLSDRELDGRVDVWAAGATLFEMLTGRPVHLAPHAAAAAVRIVTEAAPRLRSVRPSAHPELDEVVARALAIDRQERFSSALAMIEALEALEDKLPAGEAAPIVTPAHRAALRTPAPVTPGPRASSASGSASPAPEGRRSSALMLVGALALVGGATAGTLLLPMPGATPKTPSAPVATSPRTTPAPPATIPGLPSAPPVEPAVPAAAGEGDDRVAAGEDDPDDASALPSAPIDDVAPGKVRPGEGAKKDPRPTTVKTSDKRTEAPACGPREVLSNGHCCPLGMVWESDRCERPLATGL